MNKLIKLHLATCLMLAFVANANSEQCSTLSFQPFELNGENYVLNLVGHNGKLVSNQDFRATISGDTKHYLASGKHTLLVEQWQEKDFYRANRKNLNKANRKIPQAQQVLTFQLNAQGNQHYQLSLNNGSHITVNNKAAANCQVKDNKLLLAKESSQALQNTDSLPKHIAEQLQRVMNDVYAFHRASGEQARYENIIPLNIYPYFGAMLDKQYGASGNGLAIKVLSVVPYSLADSLGLQPGDQIVTIGMQPIDDSGMLPAQVLGDYISGLEFNGDIRFEIVRAHEKSELTGRYDLPLIPEVNYQLSNSVSTLNKLATPSELVLNNSMLPADLKIKLDTILLAVSQYYLDQGKNASRVALQKAPVVDRKFGLMVASARRGAQGIEVVGVTADSPAAKVGLANGDVLLSMNEQTFNAVDIKVLDRAIASLSPGQNYAMKVLRTGKEVMLSGTYQPMSSPAFTIELDLSSIKLAQKRLEHDVLTQGDQFEKIDHRTEALLIRRRVRDTMLRAAAKP